MSNSPKIDVLDGRTLATLSAADMTGVEGVRSLSGGRVVARRCDVAGGQHLRPSSPGGSGARLGTRRASDRDDCSPKPRMRVAAVVALPNDDLLEANTAELFRLGVDGARRWAREAQIADFKFWARSAE